MLWAHLTHWVNIEFSNKNGTVIFCNYCQRLPKAKLSTKIQPNGSGDQPGPMKFYLLKGIYNRKQMYRAGWVGQKITSTWLSATWLGFRH